MLTESLHERLLRAQIRVAQLVPDPQESLYILWEGEEYRPLSLRPPLPRLGALWPGLWWPEWEAEELFKVPFQTPLAPPPSLERSPAAFTIPYGPVRETVAEAIEHRLISGGELILRLELHPFRKRRKVEHRLAQASWLELPRVAERLAAMSSIADTLAIVQAAEDLLGLEVPPRAQIGRLILAELERIYNHLDFLAQQAQSTTLRMAAARGFTLKEEAQRLNFLLTGSRFLRGWLAVGGLSQDLAPPQAEWLKRFETLAHRSKELAEDLLNDELFIDRLEGTGVLERRAAQAFGVVGPTARASGLSQDIRLQPGYGLYPQLGLGVPWREAGDALARAQIRIEELMVSFELVRRGLEELDDQLGPTLNPPPPRPAHGHGFGFAEGPRGETLAFVQAQHGQLRWSLRPASALLWPAFASTLTLAPSQMDYLITQVSFHALQSSWDR